MVRICKAGLGMALAAGIVWAGMAWSQTPPASSIRPEAASSQVTMTVHENGKALQCRVLNSWKCPNGARAFQLEVQDSGEKLTIMEDGPGSTFQNQSGRMRSLPMRIFHWGRSKTSPAGAPVPPDSMVSEREIGEPKILSESDPVLVRITPEPVAPSGSQICSVPADGSKAAGNKAAEGAPGAPIACGNCSNPCSSCEGGKGGGRILTHIFNPPMPADQGPALVPGQTSPGAPTAMPGLPSAVREPSGNPPRNLANRIRNALTPETGRAPEPLTNRVSPDIRSAQGPQLAEMAGKASDAAVKSGSRPAPSTSPQIGALPPVNPATGPVSAPVPERSPAIPTGTLPPPYQGPGSFPSSMGNQPVAPGNPMNQGNQSGFPGMPTEGAGTSQQRPGGTPMFPGQGAAKNEPRDWRTMWGKTPTGQSQTPGQSLVEPIPSGKGPAFQATKDSPSGTRTPTASPLMPPASKAQNSTQPDPLLSPERYGSPRVENKSRGDMQPPPVPNGNASAMPLGMQSVISAHNGMDMPLRYVPVPTVTIPQPLRPPGPPRPEIPKAPAPADWVNAFSPGKNETNGANAPPNGQPPVGPMAGMGPGYMPGYYGPMVDPRMAGMPMPGMPYAPGPGMYPGMMPPPGMRGPSRASPQMEAALAMFAPKDAPLPLSAYKSPRPIADIAYPKTYPGPMAPNPVAGNVNPQAFMPPLQPYYAAGPAYPPAPYYPPGYPSAPGYPPGNPPMPVPMPPPEMGNAPGQLLGVLFQSPYPAQREWAALNLAALDLRAEPEVLQALLTAAQKDPAASVRAGCVQCMVRQNLTAQPVLQTLHTLKSDPDPRVRTDAEHALIRLTGSYGTPQAIQPANARQ